MKYDDNYLRTLYIQHDLMGFLELVDVGEVQSPRLRAVLGAIKRSIDVLYLEFNPLPPNQSIKKINTQG